MDTQANKVFIVDDSPSMRVRLAEILEDIGGIAIVGEAGTPDDAVAGIARAQPTCVLLDYQLEGGTGLDVLRSVHPQSPEIVFIVLTNHTIGPYRQACMAAGASYFFDKSSEFDRIREVLSTMPAAH
jgi:DNA-binding NarL/FixJ family response regulator